MGIIFFGGIVDQCFNFGFGVIQIGFGEPRDVGGDVAEVAHNFV